MGFSYHLMDKSEQTFWSTQYKLCAKEDCYQETQPLWKLRVSSDQSDLQFFSEKKKKKSQDVPKAWETADCEEREWYGRAHCMCNNVFLCLSEIQQEKMLETCKMNNRMCLSYCPWNTLYYAHRKQRNSAF